MAVTDFKTWLEENLFGTDYEDVYALYQTVQNEQNNGLFEISRKGNRLFVKRGAGEYLMISSEEARNTFLKMIEDGFCGGMDIEGYYNFHRAMEKDD